MIGWTFIESVAFVGVVAALAVGAWVARAFNRLVRDRNLVAEGWSGIDVQLKRRHDLVPTLVEAVRGYSRHERGILEEVTRLRAGAEAEAEGAEGAASPAAAADRENRLTDRLKQLFALAEAYPDLKADRNFRRLMTQLTEIEDQLQYARRYYNGAVRNLNIRVESFPGNLVAAALGFRTAEFFQIATATERQAPSVELGSA